MQAMKELKRGGRSYCAVETVSGEVNARKTKLRPDVWARVVSEGERGRGIPVRVLSSWAAGWLLKLGRMVFPRGPFLFLFSFFFSFLFFFNPFITFAI
jgi:hypothetical protein